MNGIAQWYRALIYNLGNVRFVSEVPGSTPGVVNIFLFFHKYYAHHIYKELWSKVNIILFLQD